MPPPARSRARRFAFLAVPLAIAATGFACGTRPPGDVGEPRWIWRNRDLREVEAAAFYAVSDLELDAPPPAASARIVGDEQFVLFVNGARIGSGDRGAAGEAQEYDLSGSLSPGRNRIVVELRSSTGAGGFWFELLAGERRLAVSDGGWTIYRGAWRGLFGERALLPGDRPMVLGASPLGRWGTPTRVRRRPSFAASLAADEPLGGASWRTWGGADEWRPLAERRRRARNLGQLVEIDFGTVRAGYLQLAYRDSGSGPEAPALLRFGVEPIAPPPVDADAVFAPIPGRNMFQDPIPRRFRYVAVAGLPGLYSAEVLAVDPAAMEALSGTADAGVGVFGVRPPLRSRSPVENKIWSELERATGLALRKVR